MSKDLDLNIRLKADGSGFRGAVNISRKELDRLSGSIGKNVTKAGQAQKGMDRLRGGVVGVRDLVGH